VDISKLTTKAGVYPQTVSGATMNSVQIVNLYKNATCIVKAGAESRHLFSQWLKVPAKKRLMVFDTETTGVVFDEPTILLHKRQEIQCSNPVIFGISLALEIGEQIVLVWARIDTKLYTDVCKLLNKPSIKVAHNARFDIRMCEQEDIKIAGQVDCTYTMARIIYDRRRKHSLQKLSEIWCPELSDWEVEVKSEFTRIQNRSTRSGNPKGYTNYSFLPDKMIGKYSMIDSFMCLMGYRILWPTIKDIFPELYEREKKVYYIINKVESRGLAFDARKAKRKEQVLKLKIGSTSNKMNRLAGYVELNPNSPVQVVKALKGLGVKAVEMMLKGKITTDAKVLGRTREITESKDAKSFIDELLNYRSMTKIVGTYLTPLRLRSERNDGIIYTSINPTDTRTGRMASRSPNLQNIPEPVVRRTGRTNPVRECFICREGFANYYFDYSQMEMAIFGLWANESSILDAYAKGEDIHGRMASYLYGKDYTDFQRGVTKNINFGIIYGMGVRAMALMYGMKESEAKANRNRYFVEFPSIGCFQEECKQRLQLDGYVEDWFGRRYHIPVNEAYKAVNALVQGSCAQIFKIALIALNGMLSEAVAYNLLLPVHDEFQIESKKRDKSFEKTFIYNVRRAMIHIPQLLDRDLRLRVDVSKTTTNWAKKKKLEV